MKILKLTDKERKEFHGIAHPILNSEKYQALKDYVQHGSVTTYDHSLRVAKLAYLMNQRLHIRAEKKELITSCLLHDYYLYDWHTRGDHLHGYHHPAIAARYAKRDFLVSQKEANAIRTHMWPLTLLHVPSGRSAWLLAVSDKICSLEETVRR